MSLISYKVIAAFIIFLITVIAVFYPLWAKDKHEHHHFLDFADAFASGIFLGAALFHLLPEATQGFHALFPDQHYPLAFLLCAGGFLSLLFLERLSLSTAKNYATIPYVLGIIIIFHSLIEGAVLGINTEVSTLSMIFLAIIAHKGSESFALSTTLSRAHLAVTPITILIAIFTVATPVALLLSTSLTSLLQSKEGQCLIMSLNAFAAGTFLYMSTLHHVNHHQRMHEAENIKEFICLLLGVILMGLITPYL